MADDDQLRGAGGVAVVGALVVIASFVAGKAARDAILLSNFEVTQLPLFVGLSAAGSLPLVVIVGRLLARWGPRRLVPALNAGSALLLLGEWLLFENAQKLGAAVIFFHLTAFGAVLVSGFWSMVNERFDARTAKRHIGRIGVGATIGGIVGGLIAERAAVYLQPSAILLVLAGLQLTCAAIQHVLQRGAGRSSVSRSPLQSRTALKLVVETPLLRNLAFIVMLGAIAATAIDYVFKVEIVAATGEEGPLRFFAIYYTATNVLTALAQILLGRPVLARLGVAQSIATLPATVTVFGACALVLPGLTAIVIARSAEMIVRSSVYRAAYELIYAPLAEHYKRSTKVILDVGAERIGDLIGAQLVGLLLYAAAPSGAFVMAGVLAGASALGVALLLPRSYTKALEQSLLVRAPDQPPVVMRWSTVEPPTLTDAGDLTAMSLLDLRASPREDSAPRSQPPSTGVRDAVVERIADLRSSDPPRVKRALGTPLTVEIVPHVVPLLAWDQVATDATTALRAIAPRCSGVLVDALLDTTQEFAVRRRLPAILEVGEHTLAAWGLWRGLADQRFEVRYRCAKALTHLRAAGHDLAVSEADVFEAVQRELSVDHAVWHTHRLLDPAPREDDDEILLDRVLRGPTSRGLEHVFTVLALALPPGPVRIAFQALCTTDRALHGTALEYLESALPPDLRALLWPHVEPPGVSDKDELEIPTAIPQDESDRQRLWAAIEATLTRIVAQPGFLGRRAPGEDDCCSIVFSVMTQLRADNHRRFQMYLDARANDPQLRFTSWLRTVAKRAGLEYLQNRPNDRPSRDEIAAELMLSHASIIANLRDLADDER